MVFPYKYFCFCKFIKLINKWLYIWNYFYIYFWCPGKLTVIEMMFIQILIITYMVFIIFVFIYFSIIQPIVKHTVNFI